MLVPRCCGYVGFGSKVRPRTFGCVAMGSALLFMEVLKWWGHWRGS